LSKSDIQLVADLLRGDNEAFERFFEAYYPRLFRYAERRVRDRSLAEDLAQQAIVNGLAALRSYRGEASLLTWLCGICRHELLREQARLGRSILVPSIEDDATIGAMLATLSTGTDDPELLARRSQIVDFVQAILDALPAPYGELLEWKYADELSVGDIAVRINRSYKATESLLTRARGAFRLAVGDVPTWCENNL
jgi:RNA polymerase sigma-70 factor (ECF subfamily)